MPTTSTVPHNSARSACDCPNAQAIVDMGAYEFHERTGRIQNGARGRPYRAHQ